jgi:hypothetical protein
VTIKSRVIALCLGYLLQPSYALAKQGFDGPPKASMQWVSQETQAMGMQMQIRRFQSNTLSVEGVLAHYRKIWGDQSAETDMPPWKMIGTKRGGRFWNVQVQSSGRRSSWGYLSTSDLPAIAEGKKKLVLNQGQNFPKMAGSTVLNDFLQKDIGRKARTLLIENQFSVTSNTSFYREHYQNNGYAAVMDQANGRSSTHVLMLSKLKKEVTLTIQNSGGKTQVVVNEVEHGF